MKIVFKYGGLIFLVCFLIVLAHTIDNYSPEQQKAKNDVKTIYTMIVNDIETTSKKDSKVHTFKVKHNHTYLTGETTLSISSGDEIQYEYIDESSNKIDIKSVTHIDKKEET